MEVILETYTTGRCIDAFSVVKRDSSFPRGGGG